MTVNLWVFRHGETDWNAQGRFQGHTDVPLNAKGLEQAHAAIPALLGQGIGAVVCSDLGRAVQTAQPLAAALGVTLQVNPQLRERCFGIFEGHTWAEIQEQHPVLHAAYQKDPHLLVPNAETVADLRARAARVLKQYAQEAWRTQRSTLLVSHGGMVRSMLWLHLGEAAPRWVENAKPHVFEVRDGQVHGVLPPKGTT